MGGEDMGLAGGEMGGQELGGMGGDEMGAPEASDFDAEDEFAATDAAAGGMEALGREKR